MNDACGNETRHSLMGPAFTPGGGDGEAGRKPRSRGFSFRGLSHYDQSPPFRWRFVLLTLLVVGLCPAIESRGESLWARRDPAKAYLFFDTQARDIGDLITVLINENTGVQNRENRAMSKETEASNAFDVSHAASGDLGSASGAAEFDFESESDRSFDGEASFRSQREFSTRLTATVVDVLPNGNLVISGRRRVVVAGDERILVVSGVVRPYDVSPDNSIHSRLIAEFRTSYEGTGQEQHFTRQGFLGKAMNWLWPF